VNLGKNRRPQRRRSALHPLAAADADVLRQALLKAALEGEALEAERDDYGQRYVVDLEVRGPQGRATVRSSWIVLHGEDFPRLTSCYVG